jgi:hypothetical protein
MKKAAIFVLLLAAISVIAVAGEKEGEVAWFDMENCEFCVNFTETPDLMEHMTWELYDISDGIVSIGTVEVEYRPHYEKAAAAMAALGEAMENGERNPLEVKMCGHCMAYGSLMMAGANAEQVTGVAANIEIITSDNPETVKMIQEYGEKSRVALAAMDAGEDQ